MKIKRNMSTQASRNFWNSWPKKENLRDDGPLPHIGDNWWEAETDLSPELLNLEDENE